jgi:hypothetical protein
MPTFFANPWGLLGLLAIPAILVIHMLREKSRRVRVSTLFLLPPMAPRTPRGRALHFIQNSWPLWLQLLCALLCTWLLADPRWVRANSFQSVAIILDSTASMSACRERVLAELPAVLRDQARSAARTEWVISTSAAPGGVLYRGDTLRDALAALDRWEPLHPRLDPAPAFATALANARGQGTILFVSDEQPESLPAGITLLAFGKPIDNVGFAGVRSWRDEEGAHWEAIVKNSGVTPQERNWTFETDSIKSRPQIIRLAPGQIETINGPFPSNERHLRVRLTPDRFPLDDELPLVAVEPKPLKVAIAAPPELAALFEKLLKAIPAATRTPQAAEADIVISTSAATGQSAIVLSGKVEAQGPPAGAIFTEPHPLMDGLIWDGLLSQGPGPLVPGPSDQTLLWQGEKPLIVLSKNGGGQQLVFNFDLTTSNAARLPAFVLLAGRFLSSVRDAKAVHFAENFECDQWLPMPAAGATLVVGKERVQPVSGGLLRAPLRAGFFSVQAKGAEVLDAACHFGDPRESDFHAATSNTLDETRTASMRQLNSLPDPLASIWLVVVAAALVGSWAIHSRSVAV